MTASRQLRIAAATVSIGVLMLVGIGVAIADDNSQPVDPTKTMDQHSGDATTYAQSTTSSGKNLSASDATQRVVQGLGAASPVQGAKVSTGGSGTVIAVRLSHNDDDVASEWESELAVGAIGELTRIDQSTISDEIASATATGPGVDGTPTTTGLGVGAITLGQEFHSPSDAALSAHVDGVAKQFGLTVGSLRILHPIDSAIAVTLVVPDGSKIDWTIDQLRAALVGGVPDVEGLLVKLDSPDGGALLRSGVAYRTGGGSLSFAPNQDSRFGAVHGGMDTLASD